VLPSRAKVTPQKLKSAARNRVPPRQVANCSSSPISSPLDRSTIVVRVENGAA
jgi:hypothetical protein